MQTSHLRAALRRHHGHLLVLAVACACGLTAASLSTPAAPQPPGPTAAPVLIFWQPSESYPGKTQFDPRLDRPVAFWRAGLSLQEVFAGIAEQTGVGIRFWPPGDQNERVRVNLYLDPHRPPSLRALMAQLMWVTDCTFAYATTADDPERPTYSLLGTTVAGSAEARIEDEWAGAMEALRDDWASRAPSRQAVEDRLAEHERALGLSADELIARYRGTDDRLLLDMLDPDRRAATTFLLSLRQEDRDQLFAGEGLTLDWDALTPAQQATLQSCLSQPMWGRGRRGRRGGPAATGGESDGEGWGGRSLQQVRIAGLNYGQVMLSGELAPSESEPQTGRRRNTLLMAPGLSLVDSSDLRPDERVALRSALGDVVSEEETQSLFSEWSQSQRDDMRKRWEEQLRTAVQERLARQIPLSPAVERLLSSFTLPLDPGVSYSLWQIQEAVASASGMHIISDCFRQPPQDIGGALQLLYPDGGPHMTGLMALRLSGLSAAGIPFIAWGAVDDERAGWEWQDAGPFLRFRSDARDLWRASMIPPDALKRLDAILAPHLAAAESQPEAASADVNLDLEEISPIAAGLTDRQLQHGGGLVCGDPAQTPAAYRQALRAGVLEAIWRARDGLRVLATFDKSQRTRLSGAGLRVAYDLTPEQREALGLSVPRETAGAATAPGQRGRRGRGGARMGRGPGGPFGFGPPPGEGEQNLENMVMRLTDERPPGRRFGWEGGPPPPEAGSGADRPPAPNWWGPVTESRYLAIWVGDEARSVVMLPRTLGVQLALPAKIGPALASSPAPSRPEPSA